MAHNESVKPTTQELYEQVRQRDQLIDEASRLLKAGSGDTSPEYQEFLRLRKELPLSTRTPELSHAVRMVRKKTKELREWLRRADRALGSTDPVDGITTFIEKQIERYSHAPYHEARCLTELLDAIKKGKWIPKEEEDVESEEFECLECGAIFTDGEALFAHACQ